MSGWLSNGVPEGAIFTGNEVLPLDTRLAGGQQPLSDSVSLIKLAALLNLLANNTDLTTVSGTRYYGSYTVGTSAAPGNFATITGVELLMGSVGGTDSLIVELHDSTGALVATSALAGTVAGTANAYQQIPFTAPVVIGPGTYYIAVQSNGTTAHPKVYNAPALTCINTGSATGTFSTSASITPPTTYTAAKAPVAVLY